MTSLAGCDKTSAKKPTSHAVSAPDAPEAPAKPDTPSTPDAPSINAPAADVPALATTVPAVAASPTVKVTSSSAQAGDVSVSLPE